MLQNCITKKETTVSNKLPCLAKFMCLVSSKEFRRGDQAIHSLKHRIVSKIVLGSKTPAPQFWRPLQGESSGGSPETLDFIESWIEFGASKAQLQAVKMLPWMKQVSQSNMTSRRLRDLLLCRLEQFQSVCVCVCVCVLESEEPTLLPNRFSWVAVCFFAPGMEAGSSHSCAACGFVCSSGGGSARTDVCHQ